MEKTKFIPEFIKTQTETWKHVPGYLNAYVSSVGDVALLNSKSELVKPSFVQWRTSKGSYRYVKIINDDFVPVTKAVHQIVCITYHGNPPRDGRKYEPNHKDGDKHNNHPSNLEWTTRSKNVQHAFDSGLCSGGVRVDVLNVITGETLKFNSLSAAARAFGMIRFQLLNVMSEHRDKPYLGQWVFVVDNSSDKKLNRYQRRSVMFKDYVTGVIGITHDSAEASRMTGVKAATIVSRTSLNTKNKNPLSLLSRYVFQKEGENLVWPEYSVEEAIESEKLYVLNTERKKPRRG